LLQKRQSHDHPEPAGPVRTHRRKRYHPRRRCLGERLEISILNS
jgi:hypothetical protein